MQQQVEFGKTNYDLVVATWTTKLALYFFEGTRVCMFAKLFVPTDGEQFFTYA